MLYCTQPRRSNTAFVFHADCDTTPKISLVKLLKEDDQYLTGVGRKKDFHQWLIICVPNHPFVSEALDMAVEAILRDKPASTGYVIVCAS